MPSRASPRDKRVRIPALPPRPTPSVSAHSPWRTPPASRSDRSRDRSCPGPPRGAARPAGSRRPSCSPPRRRLRLGGGRGRGARGERQGRERGRGRKHDAAAQARPARETDATRCDGITRSRDGTGLPLSPSATNTFSPLKRWRYGPCRVSLFTTRGSRSTSRARGTACAPAAAGEARRRRGGGGRRRGQGEGRRRQDT